MKNYLSKFVGIAAAGLLLLANALSGQGFQGMDPGYMMAESGPPPHMQDTDMPGPGMSGRQHQGAMFRIWKLTEYLDLTEEQGAKFFPRVNKFRETGEGIREEHEKLSRDFLERIESGKVSKRATETYLEQMNNIQKQRLEERINHIMGMSDLLSDEQYARYAAFDDHFRRQIKERMSNRKMGRDRMRGSPGDKRKKNRR